MPSKIIRNAIICKLCDSEIESHYRHDFRCCPCGKVCVDGGKDYLRRVGEPENYTDVSEVKELQQT